MLKRTPSLALRASLIFMAVYMSILLVVVGFSAAASWADRGAGNLRGPVVAAEYAKAELREEGRRLVLEGGGRLADLRARNPGLWLIVLKDNQAFTLGPVSDNAKAIVRQLRGTVTSVMIRLPGQPLPLGGARLRQIELPSGPALLAVGGIDPETLSARESLHLLLEPEVALMLAVIAGISLLAMLISVPVFVRAVQPITEEAASIGPDDPARRLAEHKAPRELHGLVQGFNAALERLQVELGRRKRFMVDVAHELRTPLAVVSLQAEGLADEQERAQLRRSLAKLTGLVTQMLDLERADLSTGPCATIDLAAVTRDVLADLAPMAIDKGYDVSLDAPDARVPVAGDAHAIARALTNLVGNAIVHGEGGRAIRVRIFPDRTVDVQDDGPGVPPELRPRLFEPFVRGDPSGEGCGLGLHLTREIMTRHGGKVSLLSDAATTFRLSFPPP